MSVDPVSGRGGNPALDKIKRRGRLGKASGRSVIEEMGASTPAHEPEPDLPAASLQEAVQPAPQAGQQPAAQQPVQQPAPQQPVQPVPFVQQVPVPVIQQIPAPAQQHAPAPAAAPAESAPSPEPVPGQAKKEAPKKASFFQTKEQGDRMRSTYNSTRPMTRYRTLSEFICAAVEKECARLEAQYNNGEPYDSDPDDVPRGRPVGG
ncbi:hypothetical protein [Arthrobacter sp. CAU 1506]|uniref:ParB family protein n=1 Tax=Arthrobacter sp. CAU 1506 TaxID=2560052 RepID=UPI001F0ED19F|nr:hypothetical protein [Arthrobacter sp. CAU 1506]